MYRIGQFSQMTKVTIKALRFYEEEGLLTPSYIEPSTGYRYYESSLLPRVHKIVSLKQSGFSIPHIKLILEGKKVGELLFSQKEKVENELKEKARELSSINYYLSLIQEEKIIKYTVLLKRLPRVIVYSKKLVVEAYSDYFKLIPEIGRKMAAANPDLKCVDDPPYCFIIYHDGEIKDKNIECEFCEAVTDFGTPIDDIVFKVIEEVPKAACVLHRGPYESIPMAYKALFDWIEKNQFVCSEKPRESYIDGIWNKDCPEEWLTEIQVPLL